MKIALIGTGNVAWHLAEACTVAGHSLVAVAGRTDDSVTEFIQSYSGAEATTLININDSSPDIILIAVPDAALADVAGKLFVKPGTIVAHTSGSQPLDSLRAIKNARTGVIYPVQTFTKYKPLNFSQIPILVEGQDVETEQILQNFAQTLSINVQAVDSAARRQLHLAAVFACNFTNHLFGISQTILDEANLPTNLLEPPIQETIAKARNSDPFTVQTGPAVRNDVNVLVAHTSMLHTHPLWQEVYKSITQSIQEQQQKPNRDN